MKKRSGSQENIAGFELVWIANVYVSVCCFLRKDIKKDKTEIESIK